LQNRLEQVRSDPPDDWNHDAVARNGERLVDVRRQPAIVGSPISRVSIGIELWV
jgi:hypothetical protein